MADAFTIDRRDLARALRATAPLASTDATLPAVHGVMLSTSGGGRYLVAVATNRYAIGLQRVDLPVGESARPDGVVAFLPVPSVKALLRAVGRKAPRGASTLVDVTVRADGLHVTGADLVVQVDNHDASVFPRLGPLLAKAHEHELQIDVSVGIPPEQLGLFAAAQGCQSTPAADMPLLVTGMQRSSGMLGVRCGADFVGAVMPRRATPVGLPVVDLLATCGMGGGDRG